MIHLVVGFAVIDLSPISQETYNISVQLVTGNNLSDNLPQQKSSRLKTHSELDVNNSTSNKPQAHQQGSTILGSDIGINAQYPKLSRMMKESGQVLIEVIQNNETSTVRVLESSGFPRLDESALSATRSALENGRLTTYFKNQNRMQISFIFRLKSL
jgi:TonB family protein